LHCTPFVRRFIASTGKEEKSVPPAVQFLLPLDSADKAFPFVAVVFL